MKQTSVNTSFLRFSVYQGSMEKLSFRKKTSSKANRDFLKQFFSIEYKIEVKQTYNNVSIRLNLA